MFYFVISNGSVLWDLDKSYNDVEDKLKAMFDQNTMQNEQFLQMDLLMRMLKLNQNFRPSTRQILKHPLFWEDKRRLKFICEIRKKSSILDPKVKIRIKDDHQKVLQEQPMVEKLRDTLDLDQSVVNNDWIAKLDITLADEFQRGYDTSSVSDLLRAIRNKVFFR